MDFSRFSAQLDASTIEHSVQPLIECLNRRIPGSNLVPYILGFVLPTEENDKTMVFINTTTWTVDTAETPSDYIENVMTSLRSSSPPLPITSGGADADSDDSDDDGDGDDDGDDDEEDDDDDDEEEKVGPATKEAIETIPVVEVVEPGRECSVCLAEFNVGDKAKEMPCKHVYHTACIDKWLGIRGFCPLCRYSLPMIIKEDEDEDDNDDDEDEDEDENDDDDDDNDDEDGNADMEEEETIEGV